MLIDIYSKLNKFFELIKPYKKIEENLKKDSDDGDLFPVSQKEGNNKKDDSNISVANSENKKEQRINENKDENKKQKNVEVKKQEKTLNFKEKESGGILNNFRENIKNFYTTTNEFFNFETKHTPNFSYKMPDEIKQNGEIKNIHSEVNNQNTTNKFQIKNILNSESGFNTKLFPEQNKIMSFDEFGKNLAEALKNAAKNKSIAGKY